MGMRIPRTIISAALASIIAGSAIAGGFSEPVTEAPVPIPEPPMAAPSSWGIVLPLAALGLLVALAVSSDDSSDTSTN